LPTNQQVVEKNRQQDWPIFFSNTFKWCVVDSNTIC